MVTITTLWAQFSRRQIDKCIFLIFSRKQDSAFQKFEMSKPAFMGKMEKKISKCCLLKILPTMLSIK